MRSVRIALVAGSLLAVAATSGLASSCASSTTVVKKSSVPPLPTVQAPPEAWASMSAADKENYMFEVVEPTMSDLFKAYDPVKYKDFGCETCHGPEPEDRGYEMPNAHIKKLYKTGTPEQKALVENTPRETLVFMFSRVVPTVQNLLGVEGFDEKTGAGFSCFNCHPKGISGQP